MGMAMIKCPVTGKPLATGIAFGTRQAFETSTLTNNRVGPCPHCGQTHTWSKPDAWLEDD
jgi:hypothetical protein